MGTTPSAAGSTRPAEGRPSADGVPTVRGRVYPCRREGTHCRQEGKLTEAYHAAGRRPRQLPLLRYCPPYSAPKGKPGWPSAVGVGWDRQRSSAAAQVGTTRNGCLNDSSLTKAVCTLGFSSAAFRPAGISAVPGGLLGVSTHGYSRVLTGTHGNVSAPTRRSRLQSHPAVRVYGTAWREYSRVLTGYSLPT